MTAVHDTRPPGHQRGIALKSAFSSSCKGTASHPLMRENKGATTAASSASEMSTKRTRWIVRAATYVEESVCPAQVRISRIPARGATRCIWSSSVDKRRGCRRRRAYGVPFVKPIGTGWFKCPDGRGGSQMIRNCPVSILGVSNNYLVVVAGTVMHPPDFGRHRHRV